MKSITPRAVLCLFFAIGLIGWGNVGFASSVTTMSPAAFVIPGFLEAGNTSDAMLCITQENTASTANLQSGDEFTFTFDSSVATVDSIGSLVEVHSSDLAQASFSASLDNGSDSIHFTYTGVSLPFLAGDSFCLDVTVSAAQTVAVGKVHVEAPDDPGRFTAGIPLNTAIFVANFETNPPGPPGPAGATGPQGIQGLRGPAGATGPRGPQGLRGTAGAAGPQGIQGLTGPAGATGPRGPQGLRGAAGAKGPQGIQGLIGPAGAKGPQGIQGLIGPAGAKGPQGPRGLTGTAGAAGPQGIQGLTGPAGATGPQGPPALPAGWSASALGTGSFYLGTDANSSGASLWGNTIIGASSGTALTEGANENVGIGWLTLTNLTSGYYNVTLGPGTLEYATSASENTAVGANALQVATSSNNTAVGANAGIALTSGGPLTAVGRFALSECTTGIDNTAVGDTALFSLTTNNYNTAVGAAALNACTGDNNTAVGNWAMLDSTIGALNTAIGASSLSSNTTGENNTGVGASAGVTADTANANTTGSNNTFLGYNSGPGSPTQHSFMTVIGSGATGDQNNTIVLGRSTDMVQVGAVAFASLPPVPTAGSFIYCADCITAATCDGSGTGHMAVSNGSAWTCQ